MVYLAQEAEEGDINNFVKPIQDALNTLVYADDSLIMDVSAHKRILSDPVEIEGIPRKLAMAVIHGEPCVYISISRSRELREEIK